MASRSNVVNDLKKLKITPKNKDYAYHVTKELKKEFNISDDDFEKHEKAIENTAKEFAKDVKRMYVAHSYNFKVMLKQKKMWFSGLIKNPIPAAPSSPPKPKMGRKTKRNSLKM